MLIHYIKRGAYNTFFYALSSVISRFINFLFLPFFLSKLTLYEFGIWDFYQMFFSMGTLLLSSCSANSMIRFYIFYHDDFHKQKQSIGNALLLAFFAFILLSMLVLCIYILVPSIFITYPYVFITLINMAFFTLFALLLSYIKVNEKLLYYSIIFCIQNLIVSLLTFIGINHNIGIKSFFYANCFSYAVFVPMFLYILSNNCFFSWSLAKEQLQYSIPLLIYNFLYMGFFILDRLFIKYQNGYDVLGLYSLLWRFGAIFQFASMALMDAWPIVLYNAQKEEKNYFLIAKLITYFCMTLLTGAFYSVVVTRCAIGYFFPPIYYSLIVYLPIFFFSLVMLEIARLMQAGLGLAIKTIYAPILTFFGLIFQSFFIYIFSYWGLGGILLANSCTFILYGLLNYKVSSYIYTTAIIDVKRIMSMIAIFCAYLFFLEIIFINAIAWQWSIILFNTWPFVLWFVVIDNAEKERARELFFKSIYWVVKKKNLQIKSHTT